MQSELDDEIREFLIESNENIALLDQQIVELEKNPENLVLISSVFRTIHSIKGICGFFGFESLGAVTHVAESILMQLRERQRQLTPELISLILESIDAVKLLLTRIEATGEEGPDETVELRARLDMAYRMNDAEARQMLRASSPGDDRKQVAADAAVEKSGVATVVPMSSHVLGEETIGDVPQQTAVLSRDVTCTTAEEQGHERSTSADGPAEPQIADSTIRVDVHLLNQLMNLVGELVLTRNQLLQAAGTFTPAVQQTSHRLNVITTELQEGVMKTRMQPIGVIWSKLPRVVRDLASRCGKQIKLEMLGAETELDKSLIEAIRDPLTHIVRNSCDHGIEEPIERLRKGKSAVGTLLLRAFHEAGAVNIEISDDGGGIDAERVRAKAVEKKIITPDQAAALSPAEAMNLIFLPGFSTASQVTSLSGRGVGMDVVKTNIEKISGSVEVAAPPQGGTIIKIKIPLTLAIIPGLIVSSRPRPGQRPGCEDRFVIPQSHLVEMTRVDLTTQRGLVETIHGATIFRHRGKLLPLIYLSRLLKRAVSEQDDKQINVIVLQVEGRQFGVVVDRICDTQEIVVKPLGQQLKHLACYGGATIMGDGQPALILDVGGIAKLAGLDAKLKAVPLGAGQAKQSGKTSELLLFRAGKHPRVGLPLSIVNRLEEIPVESVERAAGQHVVSYRGELLPLFQVASLLGDGEDLPLPTSGRMKIIVINGDVQHDGDSRIGLVVDEITDIVEGVIEIMRTTSSDAILGSAVIGGGVTDLLDVTAIQGRTRRRWSRTATSLPAAQRVVFYDPWPMSREMTHAFLVSAGHWNRQVASAEELQAALSEGAIDVLMVADDGTGLPEWWTASRKQDKRLLRVPEIRLMDTREAAEAANKTSDECDFVIDRHDRAGLLRAIHRAAGLQERERAA